MFLPKVNEHNRLELDLLDAHLFAFPEEICETSGLEVLKLCTDDIHSIPEGIAKLRKLEEIHLHTSDYHNSITSYLSPRLPPIGLQEVPTVVSLLPCLKVLSVCGNRGNPLLFDELMSCQLPSTLVEVEMVDCGLTQATLSLICNNVKLCKVNLAHNYLQLFKYCNTEMIREATVLNDLEELDLSWNENLQPFSCTGLTKLKKLNLRGCNIQQLPAEWNDLHDLEELDLSRNKNLHPFSCTGLTKLKKLNLSGCNIQQLPAEWNDLHDLEELDLSWNKNLHPFSCTGLTKLKKLNLSGCNIQQLPAEWNDLHDLEELDLSRNKNLIFMIILMYRSYQVEKVKFECV